MHSISCWLYDNSSTDDASEGDRSMVQNQVGYLHCYCLRGSASQFYLRLAWMDLSLLNGQLEPIPFGHCEVPKQVES